MTVYQPNDFRPFNFSIFSAHIPKLRKQWLFYDLLSADSITGQVDGVCSACTSRRASAAPSSRTAR